MALFIISLVITRSDIVNVGSKMEIDKIEADYIEETSTGYALINNRSIVYTVPAGLLVEKI